MRRGGIRAAARGMWLISVCHVLRVQVSANKELLNGTALDEWVRSFALRMGHDVKLSVRVWLQLYRRPSETLPKPPPAKATASESRPATILMVVPDAGVSFWVQQWNTQGALGLPNHVPCFPLPGIAGNAVNWPLVNRTVAAWRSSGGVMVAGFGRLLHVFASKATATGQVGRAKHAVVCLEPCAALSCAHATHPRLEHCRQARLDLKPTLLAVDEAHLAAKFSCSVGGQKVVLSKFLMVVAAEARLLITGALLSRQECALGHLPTLTSACSVHTTPMPQVLACRPGAVRLSERHCPPCVNWLANRGGQCLLHSCRAE